ncbi:MAG: hypothetical protein ACHQRM_15195 [Bacteroidia bacterium]
MESDKAVLPGNKWVQGVLFLCFVLFLGYFQFVFHEFWKDEWQAWFIANEPKSVGAMWHMLASEGHPVLWFLILRGAGQLTNWIVPGTGAVYIIQGVHLLLTVISLWFIFFRFRIPLLLRVCIASSYFIAFEYGVINRGYILVILCLFALIPWLRRKDKNPYTGGILLFLLTQTEVYGMFAALAVGVYLFMDSCRLNPSVFTRITVIPGLFLLSGAGLFFLSIFPANTSGDTASAIDSFVSLYAHTFCIGFIPPGKGWAMPSLLISLVLLALIVFILRENKALLFAYLLFSAAFWVFGFLYYQGGPRQWGLHFVFLVFVLELTWPACNNRLTKVAYGILLLMILPAQLIYAGKIMWKEKKYLFSNSIEAGQFISRYIPPQTPIIGINKPYCTPVIGYCNHRFFSLPEGDLFSYAVFREKLYLPTEAEVINFYEQHGQKDLYVLSWKLLPAKQFSHLEPVAWFNKPSIREEEYFLYKMSGRKSD